MIVHRDVGVNINNSLNSYFNDKNIKSIDSSQLKTEGAQETRAVLTELITNSNSEPNVDALLMSQLGQEFKRIKFQPFPMFSSAESFATHAIIAHQNEGLMNNESSNELLERLDQSTSNIKNAYRNTSDILADLGQLGAEQKSFLASSESRVANTSSSISEEMTRRINNDANDNVFSISVKTKEGDTVVINLNSVQSYDDKTHENFSKIELSYEVDGDLSDEEHAAMAEILAGVGELADEYFSNIDPMGGQGRPAPEFNMDFLNNFDNQQLESFDLSFSAQDLSASENHLNLSYEFDTKNEEQTLDFDFDSGHTLVTFNVDMSVYGQQDDEQMKHYLNAMEESFVERNVKAESYHRVESSEKGTASTFSIFKDVFQSMSGKANQYTKIADIADEHFGNGRELVSELTKQVIKHDPRYVENNKDNKLGEGISKLADFKAEFKVNDYSANNKKHSINIEQETTEDSSPTYQGVSQQKNFHTNMTGYNFGLMTSDYDESYNISAAIEGNDVVALKQDHNTKEEFKKYTTIVENGEFVQGLVKNSTLETQENSNIRLIEGMWLENSSQQQSEKQMDLSLKNNAVPINEKHENTYSSIQFSRLIGQLDPSEENKINDKLNSIDLFMKRFSGEA